MNDSKTWWPRGGFEERLEAELVRVVAQRAAVPQRRPVVHRPVMRAGLAAAGAAAVTAGTLGAVALSHPASAPGGGPATGVHIRTVDSRSDGTIHVTWDKSRYFQDHAGLQQALRAAGFPVLIKEGVFCRGAGDNGNLDSSGVGPGVSRVMTGEPRGGTSVAFVFTPSAMPAGDELFIGFLSPSQLAVTHGRPGSVERLVPAGGPLTCTTQPPPAASNERPSGTAKA
jgi:hypothetical protein